MEGASEKPGRLYGILWNVLRWGIAIAGITWVLLNISLRDEVWMLNDRQLPVRVKLAEPAAESAPEFLVLDPVTGRRTSVERARVVNEPDQKTVTVVDGGATRSVPLRALQLSGDINRSPQVERLLVELTSGEGTWIRPSQVVGGYQLRVPKPRVIPGISSMVRGADPVLLILAVLVFPLTFLITSVRWRMLLSAVDVHITLSRAFVINMVGAFYNSFLVGSTGGDVLKAYYASKQTRHKTRAVMSVFVDRVLGLIALVILGGIMAAYGYATSSDPNDPTARASRKVAIASAGVLGACVFAVWVLGHPVVRRKLGLSWVVSKMPKQRHVQDILDTMRVYKRRPTLVLWAIVMTLPVHITVVVSAMLAGFAFGLPLSSIYYFVCVPVIVLSGAIPISPQGAGVMEYFAILLTSRQGASVSQAFALTMSIRLVQIFWNLTGGIFVFRGGYHAPTEREQASLESELDAEATTDEVGDVKPETRVPPDPRAQTPAR